MGLKKHKDHGKEKKLRYWC